MNIHLRAISVEEDQVGLINIGLLFLSHYVNKAKIFAKAWGAKGALAVANLRNRSFYENEVSHFQLITATGVTYIHLGEGC